MEFWAGTAEMFDDYDIDKKRPWSMHFNKMAWSMFIALAIAMYKAHLTADLIESKASWTIQYQQHT